MAEKIKADVDSFENVKKCPINFAKTELFSILKPKVVYLPPFLPSLSFPKFQTENLMYFRHKYLET